MRVPPGPSPGHPLVAPVSVTSTRRVLFWLIAGTALLYVPLAITYMWFAFDEHAPRLQEALNASINGRDYAAGQGSVAALRAGAYTDSRAVMTLHTTLGGVALGLTVLQFTKAVKARPKIHRWVGRTAIAAMVASMLSALVFWSQAPVVEYPGWLAFRLQLLVLAMSTLGSAALALQAIRRGDVQGHRAWMGLHLSFLMTAPLLRLFWIAAGRLFPDNLLLDNVHLGAVTLAVLAPAAGAVGFMLTRTSCRTQPPIVGRARPTMIVGLGAILGCATLVLWGYASFDGVGSESVVWLHITPVLAYVVVCAIGCARARRGDYGGVLEGWRQLMIGAAASPWTVLLLAGVMADRLGPSEALLVGLMVGAGAPMAASFAIVVANSSRAGSSAADARTTVRLQPEKGLR